MSTPTNSEELRLTDEDMKTLSTEELLDKFGKILATGRVKFPGLRESGEEFARHMEAVGWVGQPKRS